MDRCLPVNGMDIEPSLRRSLFKIVWGCATTLFACTYVAIHPNVSVNESGWVVLLRRIGLMIAMGLVPELVVVWALQQRILASKLRIINHAKGWTQAHAFFMIMGGFRYYKTQGVQETLDYEELVLQNKQNKLQWPSSKSVKESEIKDHSKADFLTKTVVVVQTLWFCIQFIVRLVLHLDVTELEIATFAYAVLNFVVYLLWWNKPFDVRSQILVRGFNDPAFTQESDEERPPAQKDQDDSEELGVLSYLATKWNKLTGRKKSSESGTTFEPWTIDFSDIILSPFQAVQKIFMQPFTKEYITYGGRNLSISLDDHPDVDKLDSIKVKIELWILRKFEPEKKSLDSSSKSTLHLNLLVSFTIIIAMIFGGIHLGAWNFNFPSRVEMWLWRASSLALVTPAVVLMILRLPGGAYMCGLLPKGLTDTLCIFAFLFGFFVVPVTYAIGRAIILILPLIGLRKLPCGAFEEIDWLGVVFPHF